MKWLLISLLISASAHFLPAQSLAFTPDEYSLQVVKKDFPRSLRWIEKLSEAAFPPSAVTGEPVDIPVETLQALYNEALPGPDPDNRQTGISAKGSIERTLLLLEGSRIFRSVREGTPEFQASREHVVQILQLAKDQAEQFKFGEKPEVLFKQWRELGVSDFPKFATELEQVLMETRQLLLAETSLSAAQTEMITTTPEAATDAVGDSDGAFNVERFVSYVESSEVGRVAFECTSATVWATESAPKCESDESLECDRQYARQCKKLH